MRAYVTLTFAASLAVGGLVAAAPAPAKPTAQSAHCASESNCNSAGSGIWTRPALSQ